MLLPRMKLVSMQAAFLVASRKILIGTAFKGSGQTRPLIRSTLVLSMLGPFRWQLIFLYQNIGIEFWISQGKALNDYLIDEFVRTADSHLELLLMIGN